MRTGHFWRRRGRFDGRHLRHRIFLALGVTIVLAVAVAGIFVHTASSPSSQRQVFESFASERFRVVWDDPARRDDLARSIEEHFRIRLTLRNVMGHTLYGASGSCGPGSHRLEVRDGARLLGSVEACVLPYGWPKGLLFGLGGLVLALWAMSGFIARMLVRPLDDLVKVVRDIGEGRLDARVQLCRHDHRGELGAVAQAVNAMAEKIERQIDGQRELLAAVSHEIRSPLTRLRMLVELEREGQGDPSRLDSMDLELKEMDSLVGQLLAQSRLEFQSIELRAIAAIELARAALERASLAETLLVDEAAGSTVMVDVSLLSRALLNLLDNAQRHGRGLHRLTVRIDSRSVKFEVWDKGPGFEPTLLPRALEAFVGGAAGDGLGLGLSLVERIAQAHGGRVTLANARLGGALVSLELPRALKASLSAVSSEPAEL